MPQQGYEYERKAHAALREYKLTFGSPAGASGNKPDLVLKVGAKLGGIEFRSGAQFAKEGVELKSKLASAGSLVLKYYDGEWHYGDTKNYPEKQYLKSIGEQLDILSELNKLWLNPGLKYTTGGVSKITPGFNSITESYDEDKKRFQSIDYKIPNNYITTYYQKKKCSYLNVGTHGLFLFGSDPLNLNEKLKALGYEPIPDFSKNSSAESIMRIRVQSKSASDYQFVMEQRFKSLIKSPYNLAPLKGGSDSEVDKQKLKQDKILRVLID